MTYFRKFSTPFYIRKKLADRFKWRGRRCEGAWTVLGSLISGSGCAYSSHALYRFVAQNRNKRDVPQVNKQNQQLRFPTRPPGVSLCPNSLFVPLATANSRTSALLTLLSFVHNEHTLKCYSLCSTSVETNFLFLFVSFPFFFLYFSSSSCISKEWVT